MRGVSPRHIFLGVMLVGALTYLGVVLKATSPLAAPENAEGQAAAETPEIAELDLSIPPDPDFSRYEAMVARNIFAPPKPPKPKQVKKVLPTPPLPSAKKKPAPPKPKKPDLSSWSYVGYISRNGQRIAILQNEANDSMKQLCVGAEFMGAKVKTIGATKMVFGSPAGEVQLSIPRDYPVVPLDKSAVGKPARVMPRPPRSRRGGGGNQ